VCHALRAPGSNVTLPPVTRAGSGAWNSGSMRTVPVKYSAGPLVDDCEPFQFHLESLFVSIKVMSNGPVPLLRLRSE
jgi:hypothetical protein